MGTIDNFRQMADKIRAIRGPAGINVQTIQLAIITRTWVAGQIVPARRGSDGGFSDVTQTIPEYYRVIEKKHEEFAETGGRYEREAIWVGPITKNFNTGTATGGYTKAQLAPIGSNGVEIIYRLTGDETGDYERLGIEDWHYTYWLLKLTRRRTTPL